MSWITAVVTAIITLTPLWTPLKQLPVSNHAQPSATANLTYQAVMVPYRSSNEPYATQAISAYALDIDTGTPLYSHASDKPLPVASITKLVTVMVVLSGHKADEVVTIPDLPAYRPEDAKLGIVAGQRYLLKDLVQAALIPSANDAADALAIYDSGSITAFTNKMNRTVKQWGIEHTNFTSANGLHEDNNYASAEALAKLAKIALHNQTFASYTSTAHTSITSLSGQPYQLTSTNRLLADPRFKGIKTGYTPTAGQSVMALADIKGHRVITVVLNSPDRFGETTALANWLERNWSWQ
jgi:serine-type D-Ala-D-Ala carboxypeptidase (penicillin-binding protein 5/6)